MSCQLQSQKVILIAAILAHACALVKGLHGASVPPRAVLIMVVLGRLRWILEKLDAGHIIHYSQSFSSLSGKSKLKFVIEPKSDVVPRLHRVLLRFTLQNVMTTIAIQGVTSVDRGHKHSSGASEIGIWIQVPKVDDSADSSGSSVHPSTANVESNANVDNVQGGGNSDTCRDGAVAGHCAELGGSSCGVLSDVERNVGSAPCGAGGGDSVADLGGASLGAVAADSVVGLDPWGDGHDPWSGHSDIPAVASCAADTSSDIAANSKRALEVVSRAKTKKVRVEAQSSSSIFL